MSTEQAIQRLVEAMNRWADIQERFVSMQERILAPHLNEHESEINDQEKLAVGEMIARAPHPFIGGSVADHIRNAHGYTIPPKDENHAAYMHTEFHKARMGHRE